MNNHYRKTINKSLFGAFDILYGVRRHRHIEPTPVEDRTPAEVAFPDTAYLALPQGEVAYREQGDSAATILFIHCFTGRMENWRFLQPLLAEHARTVAFDLWGFGASARLATLSPIHVPRINKTPISTTTHSTHKMRRPPHYTNRDKWSGQRDLNSRPSGPKPDALPGCAMPRTSSEPQTQ